MFKSKAFAAATVFVSVMTFSSVASATIFQRDYNNQGVWSSYDDQNDVYALRFRSDLGKDGFYLVVTDGANPKGDEGRFAILYGDLESNRITAYTYEDGRRRESYTEGTFLGTFENAFSDAGPHRRHGYEQTQFNLDVSEINNALGGDWKGVVQGEETGIWFHQTSGSDFTYGEDGTILDYQFTDQMFLDRGRDDSFTRPSADCVDTFDNPNSHLQGCTPTQLSAFNASAGISGGSSSGGGSVPAPGGLALVLVGLLGLNRMRRRHKS